MGVPDQADPLAVALDELSALGSAEDDQAIAGLRDRLASQRLRVLFAGEAKRGKSTLVNALLGMPRLPTGVLPLTALATTVPYGQPEAVTATLAGTCHLEKALDEADALRGATAREIAARDLELSRRLAKIDGVLALVSAVAL